MNTVAKKIGKKSCGCAGIRNHRKEVAPNSQETKELICSRDRRSPEFWRKKLRVQYYTWSAILRCFNQRLEKPDEIPDWLTQRQTVLLPKTEDLSNERNCCPITCLNT